MRIIIMMLATLFIAALPMDAQDAPDETAGDARAAVVRVAYRGVEVRRNGTEAWIALRQNAEFPIGAGDSVRTDDRGRARILFSDDVEILLLAVSTFTLERFETLPDEERALRLYYRLSGQLIQRVETGVLADLRIETAQFVVDAADGLIAVEGGDIDIADAVSRIIVAEGNNDAVARVQIGEMAQMIEVGNGLRVGELPAQTVARFIETNNIQLTIPPTAPIEIDLLTALETPASFALLEGVLLGCPGIIAPRGVTNLNVRIGPTVGYTAIGAAEAGIPVRLLGISPDGARYRIQYRASFGWIITDGVQADCSNLPIYPYEWVETFRGVYDIQPDELALLRPFFGEPEADPWFYR